MCEEKKYAALLSVCCEMANRDPDCWLYMTDPPRTSPSAAEPLRKPPSTSDPHNHVGLIYGWQKALLMQADDAPQLQLANLGHVNLLSDCSRSEAVKPLIHRRPLKSWQSSAARTPTQVSESTSVDYTASVYDHSLKATKMVVCLLNSEEKCWKIYNY